MEQKGSGSVITNNLLDAVPCSGRACYSNVDALNAKYAINDDGKLLLNDDIFWHEANNGDSLVDNNTAYFSKSLTNVIAYNKATNLYYDYNEAITYNYSVGKSICLEKDMRWPIASEITVYVPSGIPSNTDYTWFGSSPYGYKGDSLTSSCAPNCDNTVYKKYVRCVR